MCDAFAMPKNLSDAGKTRILALKEEKVPMKNIVRWIGGGVATVRRVVTTARGLTPHLVPQYKSGFGKIK